jgi:hypothetical protein
MGRQSPNRPIALGDLLKMLHDASRSVGVVTKDSHGPAKGIQSGGGSGRPSLASRAVEHAMALAAKLRPFYL